MTNRRELSQTDLIRLCVLVSVLKMLGLGCDAAFPSLSAVSCGSSAQCTDKPSFGTTSDLWCLYTASLKDRGESPACLRIPCKNFGQICPNGGVCEAPDAIDTRHNADPQNPLGHCKKFVCKSAADCLKPTPQCELGFCQPDHILDYSH
jgi:hypothetical protein